MKGINPGLPRAHLVRNTDHGPTPHLHGVLLRRAIPKRTTITITRAAASLCRSLTQPADLPQRRWGGDGPWTRRGPLLPCTSGPCRGNSALTGSLQGARISAGGGELKSGLNLCSWGEAVWVWLLWGHLHPYSLPSPMLCKDVNGPPGSPGNTLMELSVISALYKWGDTCLCLPRESIPTTPLHATKAWPTLCSTGRYSRVGMMGNAPVSSLRVSSFSLTQE